MPRGQLKVIPSDRENFTQEHLNKLIEMHPPVGMPNGNVGTPTKIFLELIRQCRLPSSVIGKLGLEFPRSRSKRKYSSVPFDYGSKWKDKHREGRTTEYRPFVRTSRGHLITDKFTERKPIENEDEPPEEEISESGVRYLVKLRFETSTYKLGLTSLHLINLHDNSNSFDLSQI